MVGPAVCVRVDGVTDTGPGNDEVVGSAFSKETVGCVVSEGAIGSFVDSRTGDDGLVGTTDSERVILFVIDMGSGDDGVVSAFGIGPGDGCVVMPDVGVRVTGCVDDKAVGSLESEGVINSVIDIGPGDDGVVGSDVSDVSEEVGSSVVDVSSGDDDVGGPVNSEGIVGFFVDMRASDDGVVWSGISEVMDGSEIGFIADTEPWDSVMVGPVTSARVIGSIIDIGTGVDVVEGCVDSEPLTTSFKGNSESKREVEIDLTINGTDRCTCPHTK